MHRGYSLKQYDCYNKKRGGGGRESRDNRCSQGRRAGNGSAHHGTGTGCVPAPGNGRLKKTRPANLTWIKISAQRQTQPEDAAHTKAPGAHSPKRTPLASNHHPVFTTDAAGLGRGKVSSRAEVRAALLGRSQGDPGGSSSWQAGKKGGEKQLLWEEGTCKQQVKMIKKP